MALISEKELSPAAFALWGKAKAAIQSGNLTYVISIIQSILEEAPNFLEGRRILRDCQISLSGGVKKKSSFFGMQGGGGASSKTVSAVKKDPLSSIPLIEKELEEDPSSESLNEFLFETALKAGMPETAVFALETIRKTDPANQKMMHKLAEHYVSLNQPLEASEVFAEIVKHHPTDSKAIKASKDYSAQASMQKQRWGENTNFRDLMKDQTQFEELEAASRTGLTKEQLEERRNKIIERYNADPNSLLNSKDLAAVYEQLEDWTNASVFYNWAHSLSQGDVALANKAMEMNDKAEAVIVAQLEAAVAADPDNADLKAQLAAKKAENSVNQLAEAQARVEHNPTDPQLRYEYGKALFEVGDFSGAIPQLQQATRNPHIRTKVLLLLGRTFKAKGMFDIAVKQLADALADLQAMDATKKELLYEKGILHEEMKDAENALDCFKQIYEVDYSYRDVAQKVESSYA